MSEHTDVGAYSLGLLEQQDRQIFEAHLADCRTCAAELAELSGMAGLLTGIEPAEPVAAEPGDDVPVTDLIRRRVTAQRRRTRWQAVLGAAASAVLIGGGVAVGLAAAQPAAPPASVVGLRHSATGAGTGITGTVGLVTKAWGTQVTLDLSKIRGPLECELVAVSKTGERRVVMGWFVPRAGYGVPGHPGHLLIQGGVAIAQHDLARLSVIVVRGRTLLNIPV
jgi:hypothetical protein